MRLDSSGYLAGDNGKRFIPVGANYWPGSCGVEMWREWPEDEILADLELMASLGFNTVRFFVRWPDFEPRPGTYDATAFARLRRFLEACAERGLRPQPSLFVGWMSGGVFWPEWKAGRNLFSDALMLERATAYARTVSERLKPFAGRLCGVDMGNELNALPESSSAKPAEVRAWCRAVAATVRQILPGVPILSGCDHQQITADTGWRLGDDTQPGVDIFTVHGYPVPGWHPVPLRGLGDPLTASLLPFYVKCVRAFGPVMLQEFGTILGSPAAAPRAEAYLRAMLPACRDAGANGYLWWCFRDISARTHPYVKNPFETELGLVDAEGRVKEGLRPFIEFARTVNSETSPDAPVPPGGDTALYFPAHYYDRDEPENPGNRPAETTRRLLVAHYLLERGGVSPGIVRGGGPIPPGIRRLVVAGAALDSREVEAFHLWVERDGGHLLWHGPDPQGWASATTHLVGAAISDLGSATPVETRFFDRVFRFPCHPRDTRVTVAPREATVLLRDETGRPLLLHRRLGAGAVTCALPDVEAGVLRQWPDGEQDDAWVLWYSRLLATGRNPMPSEFATIGPVSEVTTLQSSRNPCASPVSPCAVMA
ncbi:endo-beta-mannanase [Opitutaceae bacterium TAV1]|nr:endo-beta-mannanase [Opitutaceae bacterium TAV1]